MQVVLRKVAEVLAVVWVGSQATKPLRAGGALMLAPLMDRGLARAQAALRLPSKLAAFWLLTASCFGAAFTLFGVAAISAA